VCPFLLQRIATHSKAIGDTACTTHARAPEIITNIDFQWSKISFVEWRNTKKTVPFWVEVLQYKDAAGENPFVDLANFAIKCPTLAKWRN